MRRRELFLYPSSNRHPGEGRIHGASPPDAGAVWTPAFAGVAIGRAGECGQPLPTNGIFVAITVMKRTLVSSGRPAM
jgi:hypothetical protein